MNTNENAIVWHAPAHEHRIHTTDWYWAVGIITVALAVAFFIVGNILLSIIVVLGIGTLLATSKTAPRILEYAIEHEGVRAGKTLYPWDTLDTFWVLNATQKTPAKLLLTSKKPLMPHIVIILSDTVSPDEIREILAPMIHEERMIEPLPDRTMRALGF